MVLDYWLNKYSRELYFKWKQSRTVKHMILWARYHTKLISDVNDCRCNLRHPFTSYPTFSVSQSYNTVVSFSPYQVYQKETDKCIYARRDMLHMKYIMYMKININIARQLCRMTLPFIINKTTTRVGIHNMGILILIKNGQPNWEIVRINYGSGVHLKNRLYISPKC